MIAVADTSPICYLILIGEIDLLPKIFGEVRHLCLCASYI
jgi:predicted nucleic acid-binding protein